MRRLLGIAFLLACVPGCGPANPYVPVTGTVKFEDGAVPKGDIATVTFQPATGQTNTKGASGSIAEDGSFTLNSVAPGDGALPGDYKVTVHVFVGYPDGKSVVAPQFTKFAQTPLSATVKSDGANHFDFIVEKP